jgi:bile acid-coenzyme A ligase
MTSDQAGTVTIGQRISELARLHPSKPAIIAVTPRRSEITLTWADLDRDSNMMARALAQRGIAEGSLVAITLPNDLEHVRSTIAAWKLGATVLPLDPQLTEHEWRQLIEHAHPGLVIGGRPDAVTPASLRTADVSADPLPSTAGPRSVHCTGGSTGRPRIIVREKPWAYRRDELPSEGDRQIGLDVGQVQLSMVSLHHAGFTKLYHGLVLDHTIVLLTRFVPAEVLRLIEEYRVNYFVVVPAQMRFILESRALTSTDVSSITTVHQSSAACPEPVKRAWMEAFGPETLYEGYSSQERIGAVWIRGDEWLEHPGSVGRSTFTEFRIITETGADAPVGTVGTVYMRSPFSRQPTYVGEGPPLPEMDGFYSLDDLGFLDEEGYLHLVGRDNDMINVGGIKVYPTEVENVLHAHPEVAEAVVVSRPDDNLGQSVHAIIVPADWRNPPDPDDLAAYCRTALSPAKRPRSYEFRSIIQRNTAGKIQRTHLSSTLLRRPRRERPHQPTGPGRADPEIRILANNLR